MLKQHQIDYILVLLLLLFSGNPLLSFLFKKYAIFVLMIVVVAILGIELKSRKSFKPLSLKFAIVMLLITIFQYFQLGYVSVLGMLNLLLKILIGGYIINYLGPKFHMVLFKVVFHLSILSLFFFVLINILGINLPSISMGRSLNSYILYGTSYEGHMTKNAGMFWEPGAHAGILTLCLALNFNNLTILWKEHKNKVLVLIVTLLTAQSTTGYLVGFLIVFFCFLDQKKLMVTLFILPLIVVMGYFFYQSTDFLKDKVEGQADKAFDQKVGAFSNTRFGSLVFDWHYIKKHPLIGNGLDEKTRYSDHRYLFIGKEGVDVIGSGNGFSNNLASLGVFFVFGYFYLLWKATRKESFYFALVVSIVVLLNLQGEQWLNFPLYLGLPFIILGMTKTKKRQLLRIKVNINKRLPNYQMVYNNFKFFDEKY
jgi:hypothetical protein